MCCCTIKCTYLYNLSTQRKIDEVIIMPLPTLLETRIYLGFNPHCLGKCVFKAFGESIRIFPHPYVF